MQTHCAETGKDLAGSKDCYAAEIEGIGGVKVPVSRGAVEGIHPDARQQVSTPGGLKVNYAFFIQDSFETSQFAFYLREEDALHFLPYTFNHLLMLTKHFLPARTAVNQH